MLTIFTNWHNPHYHTIVIIICKMLLIVGCLIQLIRNNYNVHCWMSLTTQNQNTELIWSGHNTQPPPDLWSDILRPGSHSPAVPSGSWATWQGSWSHGLSLQLPNWGQDLTPELFLVADMSYLARILISWLISTASRLRQSHSLSFCFTSVLLRSWNQVCDGLVLKTCNVSNYYVAPSSIKFILSWWYLLQFWC